MIAALRGFVNLARRLIGMPRLIARRVLDRRRPGEPDSPSPAQRDVVGHPRVDVAVAALLMFAAAAFVVFVVVYIAGNDTQLLGLAFGVGLLALAAAAALGGSLLVAQEEVVEKRPELESPTDSDEAAELITHGGDALTRRRLLGGAAGLAAGGIVAAAAVPIASLGPNVDSLLNKNPWRAGVGVVDVDGKPLAVADVTPGSFVSGFPEHASSRAYGAQIVLVFVEPSAIAPGLRHLACRGVVAFSKICTHAGCSVALYRKPTYQPTSPRAALVCPCHYSTFDPANGAKVLFGPAGRPLPQLPLRARSNGQLEAAAPLNGPVGPAWWAMRRPS